VVISIGGGSWAALIEIKPHEAKWLSEIFLDFANGGLGSLKLPKIRAQIISLKVEVCQASEKESARALNLRFFPPFAKSIFSAGAGDQQLRKVLDWKIDSACVSRGNESRTCLLTCCIISMLARRGASHVSPRDSRWALGRSGI
jgi:hypothetical protein